MSVRRFLAEALSSRELHPLIIHMKDIRTLPPHAARGRAGIVLLGIIGAACSGEVTGAGPRTPGVHVVSGASLADTANAEVSPKLRVRVRGEDGQPLAGKEVVFRGEDGMHVLDARGWWMVEASDTTDSDGRAEVAIKFGARAGTSRIVITVPETGAADTARYDVRPGAPARVVLEPGDTTVYVGRSFKLRGVVTDRNGNRRTEAVTYAYGDGPVALADGVVTGQAIGRARVIAQYGTATDAADVSVVPTGTLAVRTGNLTTRAASDVVTMGLDGSEMRTIAPPFADQPFGFTRGIAWSPDGGDVLVAQSSGLTAVNRATGATRLLLRDTTSGARFSRDGVWIFYRRSFGLYRRRADGSGAEQSVNPPRSPEGYQTRNYLPSPSPDTRYMAYLADVGETGSDTYVRFVDLLTGARVGPDLPGRNVAWSPTGEIVYQDRDLSIHLIRLDGTEVRDFGRYPVRVSWFDFSPDGRWLVAATGWGAPLTLIDTTNGKRLPLEWGTMATDAAWRP